MDWQTIVMVVMGLALLVAGGYIRRLWKELRDVFTAITDALDDDDVTKAEINRIILEVADVRTAVASIVRAILQKRGGG